MGGDICPYLAMKVLSNQRPAVTMLLYQRAVVTISLYQRLVVKDLWTWGWHFRHTVVDDRNMSYFRMGWGGDMVFNHKDSFFTAGIGD